MENRGVQSIKRTYHAEDMEPDDGINYIWDTYSDDAIEDIVKSYWRNLVDAYQETAEASFPEMDGVFDDFQEVTDIVVEIDVEGRHESVGPEYDYYFLRGDNTHEISFHFHWKASPDNNLMELPVEGNIVSYQGGEYEWIQMGKGTVSNLLETAPLLNEVYDWIGNNLHDAYFRNISSTPHIV